MKVVVHSPTLTSSDDDRIAAAVLAAVRAELRRLETDNDAVTGNAAPDARDAR